jgi:5-methylcytosine-specific restriction enzyme subunit McrC
MLKISEHFQFYNDEHLTHLSEVYSPEFLVENKVAQQSIFFKNDTERPCVSVSFMEEQCKIESSYFIGLAWLRPWNKPIMIEPKVNTDSGKKVNHIKMLTEALTEPENLNHLDDLTEIHFNQDWIEVEGDHDMELTPFFIGAIFNGSSFYCSERLKKRLLPSY